MSLDRGRGPMRIAITFRDQSKHKGRGNKRGYTHLGSGEAEFLPHFVEFETRALASHESFTEPLEFRLQAVALAERQSGTG